MTLYSIQEPSHTITVIARSDFVHLIVKAGDVIIVDVHWAGLECSDLWARVKTTISELLTQHFPPRVGEIVAGGGKGKYHVYLQQGLISKVR